MVLALNVKELQRSVSEIFCSAKYAGSGRVKLLGGQEAQKSKKKKPKPKPVN